MKDSSTLKKGEISDRRILLEVAAFSVLASLLALPLNAIGLWPFSHVAIIASGILLGGLAAVATLGAHRWGVLVFGLCTAVDLVTWSSLGGSYLRHGSSSAFVIPVIGVLGILAVTLFGRKPFADLENKPMPVMAVIAVGLGLPIIAFSAIADVSCWPVALLVPLVTLLHLKISSRP